MEDAPGMRGGQPSTELPRDIDALAHGQAANAFEQARQILAVDVLHRQVQLTARVANVVDTADVWMRNLPRQPHLLAKPVSGPFVGAERRQELEGNGLSELEILRAVDLSHAAATLQRNDSEAAGEQGAGPESSLGEWSTGGSGRSARRAESLRGHDRRTASRADEARGFVGRVGASVQEVMPCLVGGEHSLHLP